MSNCDRSLESNGQTLGVIAGAGQFPSMVVQSAASQGFRIALAGFKGHTDPALAQEAHTSVLLHVGQLGKLLDFFKINNVSQVVFAGSINKPRALDIRPDFRAAKVLWRMRGKGDDALLRGVIAELEAEGFRVRQAASILPQLLAPEGVVSKRAPTTEEWEDLRLAWGVAAQIGRLDIGQCVVLKRGVIAAVEALEGTDAAIARGTELAGAGCVVLKRCKPGQDERVDLPAIGLETIRGLVRGKASCLGYEAGKSLFFDFDKSIALAAEHKICIVGVTAASMNDNG